MPRKLKGLYAELFKTWVQEDDSTIVDIEGKHYLVKPLHNIVQEEFESDEELNMLIRQAKMNIAGNRTYTTEEILEAIEKGHL
ncbi:hypothetical protein ACWGPW_11350 [Paenibacillus chitinolyticus]